MIWSERKGWRSMMSVGRVLAVAMGILFAALVLSAGCDRDEPVPIPAAGKVAGSEKKAEGAFARQDPPPVPEVPGPGRDVYLRTCIPCHGERGDGVPSARLDSKKFVGSLGEAGLTKSISEGKGLMPAWSKAKGGPLSYEDIKNIVSYLRAYSALMPEPTPRSLPIPIPTTNVTEVPVKAVTMVDQGRQLFTVTCGGCHSRAEDIASKATPAIVKQKGVALNERESSAIFEYLRSLASAQAPAQAPADASSGVPVAPTDPGKAAAPLTGKPPALAPHRTQGRENMCSDCHGVGRANPYPMNHRGRTNDVCVLCHVEGQSAPPVRHEIKGREGNCLACHAVGGLVPAKPTHAKRMEQTCLFCHDTTAPGGSGTRRVRPIPHLVGTALCVHCHGSGGIGKRMPTSHADVSEAVCTLCHPLAAQRPTPVPARTPERALPPGQSP